MTTRTGNDIFAREESHHRFPLKEWLLDHFKTVMRKKIDAFTYKKPDCDEKFGSKSKSFEENDFNYDLMKGMKKSHVLMYSNLLKTSKQ